MIVTERTVVKLLRELIEIIRAADDTDTAEDFLFPLLTPRERGRLALRWRLVCMLRQGLTQREISRLLGVSLCKITRGSRELKHGPPAFKRLVDEFLAKHKHKNRKGS